jgi:hypothetical protein
LEKESQDLIKGLEKHVSSMSLKKDTDTGRTPERKDYKYPSAWELTEDHDVLVEKFRQVQDSLYGDDDKSSEKDEISQTDKESIRSMTENEMEVGDEIQVTKLPVPRRSHRRRGGVLAEVN